MKGENSEKREGRFFSSYGEGKGEERVEDGKKQKEEEKID